VNATNGIEQCQWDSETGKIYLNVPGTVSVPGAVLVLDPKTISNPKAAAFVEKVFTIPLDACIGPMGMAIGPHNQILLGCNFAGPNSAIINAHSGAVESVLKGYGGNDEVWFNPGDGHYLLPICDATCRAGGTGALGSCGVVRTRMQPLASSVLPQSVPSFAGTGRYTWF
jgi:hypothetical protein